MNAKIFSAVILVGGMGSRFSSIKNPPKQLSRLNNEYILMHIIKHYRKYGIKHFVFPLGYKNNYFKSFFLSKKNISKYKFNIINKVFNKDKILKNKINISFFNAGYKTSKLFRVLKSLKFILSDDFIVSYGDDLSDINIKKLLERFNSQKQKKIIFAIFKSKSQYGHVIVKKNGSVKKFIEKPFHQYPVNIGNYVFNKKIFKKYFTKNGEIETTMLQSLAKKNLLQTFEHRGYFYSINDKKELDLAKQKLKRR